MSVRIQSCFILPSIQRVLCPENKAAINFVFHPDDNHHLIIHESAGLEPGDIQGLRAIQDFISDRTDSSRSARERLHAVW